MLETKGFSGEFILYTRKNCHLCEVAKEEIRKNFGSLPIREIDVDTDPTLIERFGEEVPVCFIGDQKAFKYRVDLRRLRRLLKNFEKRS